MRILVVEDDPGVVKFLKRGLEAIYFTVDVARDGARGSYLARTNEYDIVLLDILLPNKNGKEVCHEVREAGKTVPIIIVSVLTEIPTKVELLEIGADDYVTKPFSFDELVARIKALERRPKHFIGNTISIDNVTLDTKHYNVTRAKKSVHLTRKEFALLEYFLRNQGLVLSRSMIMEHVWDIHADPFSNTIESHIRSLRQKIEGPKYKKLIHTIPGCGYKIDVSE